MEQIRRTFRDMSLKKSFVVSVVCTVVVIFGASLGTIAGCKTFQKFIMPDSNNVFLSITTTYTDGTTETKGMMATLGAQDQLMPLLVKDGDDSAEAKQTQAESYSIDKIENSFDSLSPKRKLAYSVTSAAMVGLPMVYSVAGVFLCALWFYKRKLDNPIRILSEATKSIADKSLDFTVQYDSLDEMGQLCNSFEKMRQALSDNYIELWNMIEERKLLNASVAHDLRNPIAIIEGYTEYLQSGIPEGKIGEEKLMHTLSNLATAAKRLERYTDSIRDVNSLEELEIQRTPINLSDVLREISDDFTVMARQAGKCLAVSNTVPKMEAKLDKQVLFRILENIFTNALRYANREVRMDFSLQGGKLLTAVSDDGAGFADKILLAKGPYIPFSDGLDGHVGMGLVISRILCRKHGGDLSLRNQPGGGALAEICISIQ